MGSSEAFCRFRDALRGRSSQAGRVLVAFRSLVSPPVPNRWLFTTVLAPFMGLLLLCCSHEARGTPVTVRWCDSVDKGF